MVGQMGCKVVERWRRKHMAFSEEVREGFIEEVVIEWVVKRSRNSAGRPGGNRHFGFWTKRPIRPGLDSCLCSLLFHFAQGFCSLCQECSLWIGSVHFLSFTLSAIFYNHKPVVHGPKLILRNVSFALTVFFKSSIRLAAYISKR